MSLLERYPPQIVRLTPTREGHVTCPQCHTRQQTALEAFQAVSTALRVACACGALFLILLEPRTAYRQYTQLPGRYTHLATQLSGAILIVNLSVAGLGFVPTAPSPLVVGDQIELQLGLEPPPQPALCKQAVVKHMRGPVVGAAFRDLQAYAKEIMAYLRIPHVTLAG
jgi:hypothetical protein